MSRFIAYTGKEDEESYTTTPVEDFPAFKVRVRPSTNKRWAKTAKKKGLKPNDQEYVALFDTSEESCKESLLDWEGTQEIWPDDGEGGLAVSDDNMSKMAARLCASVIEGPGDDGKTGWKTFWQSIQEQVIEQRARERKN